MLKKNYKVIALSRDRNKAIKFNWYNEVQFYSYDIKDNFNNIDINPNASLIHLAWQGLPNYSSQLHIKENLPINYKFIKSLVKFGVKKVLVTGTCFEYGKQSGAVMSSALCKPNNNYGSAKNELHKKLRLLQKKIPYILQWSRIFYTYGQGQNPNSLLPQLDLAISENKEFFKMSQGDQLLDFLSIEEVVSQIFEVFDDGLDGTFNICSGKPISVINLVKNHLKKRGAKTKLKLGYYPYKDYESRDFWGVRDVYEKIYLPALPNAPFFKSEINNTFAPIKLRRNIKLDFVENAVFDSQLINYSKNYENSQAYSKKFVSHMTKVISILKKNFKKGSRMIEVGCGKGDFLEMLLIDGFFKVRGYDASYDGRNPLIEKRYLNIDDKLEAELIVLRHVLEHVKNPYKFLEFLKNIFIK